MLSILFSISVFNLRKNKIIKDMTEQSYGFHQYSKYTLYDVTDANIDMTGRKVSVRYVREPIEPFVYCKQTPYFVDK